MYLELADAFSHGKQQHPGLVSQYESGVETFSQHVCCAISPSFAKTLHRKHHDSKIAVIREDNQDIIDLWIDAAREPVDSPREAV